MIPAGQSGKLEATIKTKMGRAGRQTKSISVATDAPEGQRIRLSVSYNVVTPIVASPGYRLMLSAVEGTATANRIFLHRTDGQPLAVELEQSGVPEGVDVSLEKVTAADESEGRQNAKPGDVWVVAAVDGDVGAMNHNGVVTLTTNHPEAPRLEVPVYVRVRSIIDVRPQRVNLWPAEAGPHGTTTLVRLNHNARESFEVTSIEVSDPKLLTAELQSQGAQNMHSMRISLADGISLNGSDAQATVRVGTSDAAKPVIDIPVQITTTSRASRRSSVSTTRPSTKATEQH